MRDREKWNNLLEDFDSIIYTYFDPEENMANQTAYELISFVLYAAYIAVVACINRIFNGSSILLWAIIIVFILSIFVWYCTMTEVDGYQRRYESERLLFVFNRIVPAVIFTYTLDTVPFMIALVVTLSLPTLKFYFYNRKIIEWGKHVKKINRQLRKLYDNIEQLSKHNAEYNKSLGLMIEKIPYHFELAKLKTMDDKRWLNYMEKYISKIKQEV